MAFCKGCRALAGRMASPGVALGCPRLAVRPRLTSRQPVAAAKTETAAAKANPEAAAAPAATQPAAAELAAAVADSLSADAPQTTAAAGANQEQAASDAADADTDAADDDNTPTHVRVAADTVPVKMATFLFNLFKERSKRIIFLQAAGAPAYAQALKALVRLQQMVQADAKTARSCVTFQPRSIEEVVEPREGQTSRTLNTIRLVVTLGGRKHWPDTAFAPAAPSREADGSATAAGAAAGAAAEADAADDSSSTKSSSRSTKSSSSSSDRPALIPTLVRPDSADEKQRLSKHMLQSAKLKVPSQFTFSGGKQKVASAAAILLYAVDSARLAALAAQMPSDFKCTVVAQSSVVELPPRGGGADNPPASTDTEPTASAAATATEALQAAAEPAGSSSPNSNTMTVVRYFVTVDSCPATRKAILAAKRRAGAEAMRRKAAEGRRGPANARPGYIEVREEEWNQLKEQLQVVPHLTEQLQIMTRQHEQLLSLLAAQQGQQQQQQKQ